MPKKHVIVSAEVSRQLSVERAGLGRFRILDFGFWIASSNRLLPIFCFLPSAFCFSARHSFPPCGITRHCSPSAAALLGLLLLLNPFPLRAVQAAQKPAPQSAAPPQTAEKSSLEAQESQALQDAVRSSEDNPQVLIKNLEAFLERFPTSARREQVLQFVYQSALRANDPQTAIQYGEKLLVLKPDDPALLSSLVDLLDRQDDASSRVKALQYAMKFVERAEREVNESAPSAAGKGKSPESPGIILAAAYLTRGKLYAKSGESDKAMADYEKSYAAYPTQQLAERLGDLAAKENDLERALNEYATAFAFPGRH